MDKLITNRTQQDVDYAKNNPDDINFLKGTYNYTDLNRVESWCNYLAQQLNQYDYTVNITTKTNWTMNDFPIKDEMKRIKNNVAILKNAYISITTLPDSLEKMTYQKANKLEKVLSEIYSILCGMENNLIYCGVSGSGQSRLWQNRFRRKYLMQKSILIDGKFESLENYTTRHCDVTNKLYTYTSTREILIQDIIGGNYPFFSNINEVNLEANHKYMLVVNWKNTVQNPNVQLYTSFGSMPWHSEFESNYLIYENETNQTMNIGIGLGSLNFKDLSQPIYELKWEALLDVTNLSETELEHLKYNLDDMIIFGNTEWRLS